VVAQVVFLRGVNVGGHRTFRPTMLAEQLEHLDVVNIGAAGTFVVRATITQARLRAELARRLPFETEITLCEGRQLLRAVSDDPFAGRRVPSDVVRFVSVLSGRPRSSPATPLSRPADGQWLVKLVARDDRLVFGMYRRNMKTIGYLGALDRLFGVPATTRSWSTITAIARALAPEPPREDRGDR
jgi:uncharacterized protein (DUF1697 family)